MSKMPSKLTRALHTLFLPTDYPKSVNPGYIKYQAYDSIQGLSSYLRGVVTTSAILTAAGVGNAEATATSAAVQWAMKDGCGMMGGLVFSYFTSCYFDSHVKEFRLFADIMNDIGLFLDMLSPLLIHWKYDSLAVMGVATFATLCRVMCGMAAGATKNCITQHFAKKGNMADLSAKEGTQETLVSLIGMVMGIGLAKFLQDMEENCKILRQASTLQATDSNDDQENGLFVSFNVLVYRDGAFYATWFVFLLLTIIHVWANYVGVKSLKLKTLNRARCEMALQNILIKMEIEISDDGIHTTDDSCGERHTIPPPMTACISQEDDTVDNPVTDILTPNECCESLYRSWMHLMQRDTLKLGVTISTAIGGMSMEHAQNILNLFRNEGYILTISTSRGARKPNARTSKIRMDRLQVYINVALRPRSDSDDSIEKDNMIQLKSFVHAMILQRHFNDSGSGSGSISRNGSSRYIRMLEDGENIRILEKSKACVDRLCSKDETLLELLKIRGWNVETLHLNYDNCEFDTVEDDEDKWRQ